LLGFTIYQPFKGKMRQENIKTWLKNSNSVVFTTFAILASFLTYSCMYAFRKPFTAATFDGLSFLGVHYKIWLITSQVAGYTLSKFIGIKLVSEMKPKKRAISILSVIGIAWIALFLFAVTPGPFNIIWLFFNGLPLGVVWGLVFSYLEGRRTTELLGAGVSVSFIFSSGFVRTVGKFLLLNYGISEFWMPFLTASVFVIPLLISVWLLNRIPPPDEKDIEQRTNRVPMSRVERLNFLNRFYIAIVPFTLAYIFLTILRDIRDNFSAEIWIALGKGDAPEIFTTTEIPVGIGVLIVVALMILIKNNKKALNTSLALIIGGMVINILATYSFQHNLISGITWMILVGFGLYLGYITYHALLFERFIATFKYISNIGFLFYVADAFGYLGSVSTFLMKNFLTPELSWLSFFSNLTYSLSLGAIILCFITLAVIKRKHKKMFPKEYALNLSR
jgi:MFS family permease